MQVCDINLYDIVKQNKVICERFQILTIIKKNDNNLSVSAFDRTLNKQVFIKIKRNNIDHLKDICNKLIWKKHDNIEDIYDIVQIDNILIIVCEFINGLNVQNYFNTKCPSDDNDIMKLYYGLLHAIDFLHSNHIVHCDIQLCNIMWNDGNIKLIDFDLSKVINDDNEYIIMDGKGVCGTENYISPECFDLHIYTYKSDIWSLGVSLYKLITNKFPYKIPIDRKYNLLKNSFKHLDLDILDEYKNVYNKDIIMTIKKMLNFKYNDRPSASELVKKTKFYATTMDRKTE